MPPAPDTLPELLQQLGSTYSPFERLKILSRAWSLLRKMTPQERLAVATQLGLDHADEVVEAIAKKSGHEASPALISMIEKAQTQGTAHLPALIADLRDPQRRAERLKQGAQTAVEGALAAPKPAPPPPKPAPPSPLPPMEAAPIPPWMHETFRAELTNLLLNPSAATVPDAGSTMPEFGSEIIRREIANQGPGGRRLAASA